MKNKIFLTIFILMFSPVLFGKEITPEFLSHAISVHYETKDEGELIRNLAKENLPILEKVIFEKGRKTADGRTNALIYFKQFSHSKIITREKFFDIACRLIKDSHILLPPNETYETGYYEMIIGGYGYHYRANEEYLKFPENLNAFFVFVQTMRKYDLILDSKTFDLMKNTVEEIQKLVETKSESWKEKILEKLSNLEKVIQTLAEIRMDKIARNATEFYVKGLVKQATSLLP